MSYTKIKFLERGYPSIIVDEQLEKAKLVEKSTLLKEKDRQNIDRRVPFTATFNANLPKISSTINKHWHLLHINAKIAESFKVKPMVAFRRNKNLREILGQTHLTNNKKILEHNKRKTGSCQACLNHGNNKCCNHITSTKTFKSEKTGEVFNIQHNLNCRSRNVIYLGSCTLCKYSQYIGKSEPSVNLRINTHRYDVNSPNGGRFDKHFNLPGHNYDKHARYIIIEQVRTPSSMNTTALRKLLEDREDFWMKRLNTIYPNGLNDHLNSNNNNQIRTFCR